MTPAEFVKQLEGEELEVYKDTGGVLTVGVGHTGPEVDRLGLGAKISQGQSDAFLRADLAWAEKAVDGQVRVPLNPNQRTALVSFAFNVGPDAFRKSTLLRLLNGGDFKGAAGEFGRWVKDGGKVVRGLVNRRRAERDLFERPV